MNDSIPELTLTEDGRRIISGGRHEGFGFFMALVWCLGYLAITQVLVGLIVVGIGIAVVHQPGESTESLLNGPGMQATMRAAMVAAHVSGIILSITLLRITGGRGWKRKIALTRLPSGTHVLLLMIGFPAMFLGLSTIGEWALLELFPELQSLGLDLIEKTVTGFGLGFGILAIAVLPGIGEELWCRGFIGRGTMARYGTVGGVFITSFLFGLIHLIPVQAIMAAVLGVVLHLIYIATRSLWAPIACHFANNLIAVIHLKSDYKLLTPLEEGIRQRPELLIPAILALTAATAYALYLTRCRLASSPGTLTWEPNGSASIELPPPGSGTRVVVPPLPVGAAVLVFGAAAVLAVVDLYFRL